MGNSLKHTFVQLFIKCAREWLISDLAVPGPGLPCLKAQMAPMSNLLKLFAVKHQQFNIQHTLSNNNENLMSITTNVDNTKDPLEIKITVGQETLDFENCFQLGDALRETITPEIGKCILDLHQVSYIDSMGLGTLLIARELLKDSNDVDLINVQPTVKDALSRANFQLLFFIK